MCMWWQDAVPAFDQFCGLFACFQEASEETWRELLPGNFQTVQTCKASHWVSTDVLQSCWSCLLCWHFFYYLWNFSTYLDGIWRGSIHWASNRGWNCPNWRHQAPNVHQALASLYSKSTWILWMWRLFGNILTLTVWIWQTSHCPWQILSA